MYLNRITGYGKPAFILLLMMSLLHAFSMAAWGAERDKARENEVKDAIVKIYTVTNTPDYFSPWKMLRSDKSSGSGFIISGNRILTNAHVVADHTLIQVRRHGEWKRYHARILHISHEADLAVLTVDKEGFFADVKPLELGPLPETQQEVLVYGFPIGGDAMSITKGILSRMEHHYYSHSSTYLLSGQIDAALNPGNSGGPVLVDHRVVGAVSQVYSPKVSENIGYMVPIIVIKHFLKDIEDGTREGFPYIGLVTQKMENPYMKKMYGLGEEETGVLVTHVFMGSPAEGKIREKDVLMAIDGHPIADDATVEFRPKERTHSKYFTDVRQVGETVNIDVLRDGVKSRIDIVLNRARNDFLLVPTEQYDRLPTYFIFGGLVFSPLTKNILLRWGRSWRRNAPTELVLEAKSWPMPERREVVVALQVLPAEINRGYHDLDPWVVEAVNGKSFKDFKEFYEIVMSAREPYVIFRDKKKQQVVIDREKAVQTHQALLETYRIREDKSADLPDIQ